MPLWLMSYIACVCLACALWCRHKDIPKSEWAWWALTGLFLLAAVKSDPHPLIELYGYDRAERLLTLFLGVSCVILATCSALGFLWVWSKARSGSAQQEQRRTPHRRN